MNLHDPRTNSQWIKISYWLAWLALLASLLYTTARYGSGYLSRETITNADAAFFPVFFRDVLTRGTVKGWELPTNPSFFPDMLLFILVDLIVPNIDIAFIIYGIAQVMLAFVGMRWVQRTLFGGIAPVQRLAETAMLLTLTVCMLFIASGTHLFQLYMLMSVHHVGVLVVIPYATILALKAWQPPGTGTQQGQSAWLLFLLAFLTALSDTLFIVQFVIPTLVASLLWARWSQLSWRRILGVNAGLLLSAAAGQWIRQMLVPISKLLNYVKGWDNEAILLAFADFRHHMLEISRVDPLLAAFWLLSLVALIAVVVICARRLKYARHQNVRELLLVASIFLSAIVISVVVAILSGNPFTTRYIFPTLYLPIFAGLPFWLALFLSTSTTPTIAAPIAPPATARWPLLSGATMLISLSLVGYMLLTTEKSALASLLTYQDPVVACLEREAAQRQIHYGLAGYWQTTNIEALAEGRLQINPVFPNLFPFFGNWNRFAFQSPIDFVIIRQDAEPMWRIQEKTLLEKFGSPKATFTCETSKIYVYDRAKPQVSHWFANHPSFAELEEVGDRAEFYGYTLLSQIDAVSVALSQGAGEQWDQDEGILAYAQLKSLPAGTYAVAFDLYADTTDSGDWEAIAITPQSRTPLNSAPITATGKSIITGTFSLDMRSDVDVVIRYNGHGTLFLDRMRIAHITPNDMDATQGAPLVFATSSAPTPASAEPQLKLLAPPTSQVLITRTVDFAWQWTGQALTNEQTFEVRLWPQGENIHYGAHDAKVSAAQIRQIGDTYILRLDLSGAYTLMQNGAGDYEWTVGIVAIEPEYQDLQIEATPHMLRILP